MAAEAEARGYESAMLSPAEAAARHPLLDADAIAGAWYNGLSGRLNPADLTACYARGARKNGAEIRENCTVEGLVASGGAISGVMTGNGLVEADTVVVCAGLWSRELVLPLGVEIAQWGCQHFYVIADTDPRLARETPAFVSPADLVYGREEVGGLLFGCFDEAALTLEPDSLPEPFTFTLLEPNWDKFAPYFDRAAELFPMLVDAPIRQFVNGPDEFYARRQSANRSGFRGRGALRGKRHELARGDRVGGVWPHHCRPDCGRPAEVRCHALCSGEIRRERAGDLDWVKAEVSATPSRYYIEAHRVDA